MSAPVTKEHEAIALGCVHPDDGFKVHFERVAQAVADAEERGRIAERARCLKVLRDEIGHRRPHASPVNKFAVKVLLDLAFDVAGQPDDWDAKNVRARGKL